jgi:hypothetical protein
VTLIEPDVYKPHNVYRHLFSPADVGQPKAVLARRWLEQLRPALTVEVLQVDLCDPAVQALIEAAFAQASVGVCAADNELAKFHFDSLARKVWAIMDAGRGAFWGDRRLGALLPARRGLLWLRGQLLAADHAHRRKPAHAGLLGPRWPGLRDDHPRQPSQHRRHRQPARAEYP